jgi:hypothetical protein
MNVEQEDNPMMSSQKRLSVENGAKEKIKVSFLRPPEGKKSIDGGAQPREEKKRARKKSDNSSSGKKRGSFDDRQSSGGKSNSSHSSKHIP